MVVWGKGFGLVVVVGKRCEETGTHTQRYIHTRQWEYGVEECNNSVCVCVCIAKLCLEENYVLKYVVVGV